MSKKQMMNKEAGFMGLEGMGALLFYLIMLAGAALLIAQLFTGGKLSEMEKSLSALRMNIQQLYTEQGTYAGLDNATVVKAGILPAGFKADATGEKITSPWNTTVTVATISDTDTTAFTIAVADVPADDCVKLAMYEVEAWDSITVTPAEGTAVTAPITDVAGATAACNGKTATFVFKAN